MRPLALVEPRDTSIVAETPQDRLDAQLGKLLRQVLGQAARGPLTEGGV